MERNNIVSSSRQYPETADYVISTSTWSLEQLKLDAVQHRLCRPRSLAWAILLQALPPPGDGDILESLKVHRSFYEDLRKKMSMDPRGVVGDDPLSQNDESAWNQHFCDNELKALILQDVVRTYPDELYFRDKDVQDLMVRVLFYWSRSHSHIGYRQGMHEILAPLLFELYLDRNLAPKNISLTLLECLNEDYLEHDSYMLFSALMKGLDRFYTTGDVVPTSCGRLPSSKVVHNPNEVVRYLNKIKEELLVTLDPEVVAHLDQCNISLELFGIRWLRLLFGREFPRPEVALLWGYLFSDGPMLVNLQYVIAAMIISMRTALLSSDPGAVLSRVMRPCEAAAQYVCRLACHLRSPARLPRPAPPPPAPSVADHTFGLEECGSVGAESSWDSEGVAEGQDVARGLAALALLRARLPQAAHTLARVLQPTPPAAREPLQQILQLAALLQCRNHALIDVETALEADEGSQPTDKIGRRQIVPVAINRRQNQTKNLPSKVKEVPLKLFNQMECSDYRGFPCLDPLRLRTE